MVAHLLILFHKVEHNVVVFTGLGLVAAHFTDDNERGKMMAISLSGYGLGIILGPQIGGITFQYCGKELPYLLLSMFVALVVALQVNL